MNAVITYFKEAKPLSSEIIWQWYAHRFRFLVLAALVVAVGFLSAYLMFPPAAHADPISDMLNTWLDGVIKSWAEALLQPAVFVIKGISTGAVLNDFATIFGQGSPGFEFLKMAHGTIISAMGYMVLGTIYLIQLLKTASRFDQVGLMVPLKEIFALFIFCWIMKALIDNSLYLCAGLYDWINTWTIAISNGINSYTGATDFSSMENNMLADSVGAAIGGAGLVPVLLMCLVTLLAAVIANIVAYVSIFGRALQIYIYAMFSPIPLSFLGADETRSYGVAFIRNYAAVCLSGIVIVVLVGMFPILVTAGWASGNIFGVVGICLLFILSMTKAGQWSREVLGG